MPSEIQSIIFKKKYWRKPEAIAWVKARGFKYYPDETMMSYRFRQHEPNRYRELITKKEKNGMSFIIGYRGDD